MPFDISPELYRELEKAIASDSSPVGIDAKKTHILILHKLATIEARLDAIERKLGETEGAGADG